MDANGIADRAGPRGAGSTPVQYPFTLFQGPDWGPQFKGIKPVEFELQTIPQSGKSWNIDEVGTAHYGMVADYVEEIRIEGGREGDRKSVVEGKSVSVRVDLGGGGIIQIKIHREVTSI